MANIYATQTYQENLTTGVGPKIRRKPVVEGHIKEKTEARSKKISGVEVEIINDLYIAGALVGLAFIGIYIYTSTLTFLAVPFAFLAFFISLTIPFIAILDAPVFLLIPIGLGLGFYITAIKCPANIRLLIFTFLFAGWVFLGFQTMTYTLYGSLPYPLF